MFDKDREGSIDKTLDTISGEILNNFQQRIWNNLTDIFIDKQQVPPKPKNLQDYPGALREAVELLRELESKISSCMTYFEHKYHKVLKQEGQKEKDAISKRLDQARSTLVDLGENSKNYDDQDELIRIFEQKIYFDAWEVYMVKLEDLLTKLQAVSLKYWNLFGAPAEGWFEYIKLMNKDCRGREEAFRKKIDNMKDNLPFIRYLPRPYEAPLLAMYRDYVNEHLDRFLLNSSWSLMKDQNTGEVGFYLSTRKDEPAKRDAILTPFKNVITGEGYKSKVTFHHWKDVFDYGKNTISADFKQMDIWDALAYDFIQWEIKHLKKDAAQATKRDYALKKTRYAKLRAKCLLPTKIPMKLNSFYFSGGSTGYTDKGKEMYKEFSELGLGIKESSIFDKMLVSFECNSNAPGTAHSLEQWAYYSKCRGDYWEYNKNPDNTPIHICPEERNACLIEQSLYEFINEIKLLHPSVVVHLGRIEDFRLFWLAYLSGIFAKWETSYPKEPNRPHDYIITVERGGQEIPINLGQVGHYQELMYNFLKNLDRDAEAVRKVVKEQWQSKVAEMEDPNAEIESWIGKFMERKEKIKLRPYMGEAQDTINRDDLIDAIWISIWRYISYIKKVNKNGSKGNIKTNV